MSAITLHPSYSSTSVFTKCGEIFVTSNADKWTFCCIHCDEPSSDIANFICHIRLEHLNIGHRNLGASYSSTDRTCNSLSSRVSAFPPYQNDSSPAAVNAEAIEIIEVKNITQDVERQPTQSIVCEQNKDMPPDASKVSNEIQNPPAPDNQMSMESNTVQKDQQQTMECDPNMDTSSTITQQLKTNLEVYAIREIAEDDLEQQEVVRVVYVNNEENEEEEEENSHIDDVAMSSSEPSDDDDESPVQCSTCQETFQNSLTLESHIMTKHKNHYSQCPLCLYRKKKRLCLFLAHIKTHKSETCFPCELCGKIFENRREFKKHLKKRCFKKVCTCFRCKEDENLDVELEPAATMVTEAVKIEDSEDIDSDTNTDLNSPHENLDIELEPAATIVTEAVKMEDSEDIDSDTNIDLNSPHENLDVELEPTATIVTEAVKMEDPQNLETVTNIESNSPHENLDIELEPAATVPEAVIMENSENTETVTNKDSNKNIETVTNIDLNSPHEKLNVELEPAATVTEAVNMKTSENTETVTNIDSNKNIETVTNIDLNSPQENLLVELKPAATVPKAVNIENFENNETVSKSSIDVDDEDAEIEYILPSGSSSNTGQTRTRPKKIVGTNTWNECLYCRKTFRCERNLLIHCAKAHDKGLNLSCHCGKTFKSRTSLKRHQTNQHKTMRFQCPVCSEDHFRENLFIDHVLTHESESCFPCQVCGNVYTSDAERLKHWRTHIRERPYGCPHCFRRFRLELMLRNHLKNHLHYFCKDCETYFESDTTLKQPYYCDECEEKRMEKE